MVKNQIKFLIKSLLFIISSILLFLFIGSATFPIYVLGATILINAIIGLIEDKEINFKNKVHLITHIVLILISIVVCIFPTQYLLICFIYCIFVVQRQLEEIEYKNTLMNDKKVNVIINLIDSLLNITLATTFLLSPLSTLLCIYLLLGIFICKIVWGIIHFQEIQKGK